MVFLVSTHLTTIKFWKIGIIFIIIHINASRLSITTQINDEYAVKEETICGDLSNPVTGSSLENRRKSQYDPVDIPAGCVTSKVGYFKEMINNSSNNIHAKNIRKISEIRCGVMKKEITLADNVVNFEKQCDGGDTTNSSKVLYTTNIVMHENTPILIQQQNNEKVVNPIKEVYKDLMPTDNIVNLLQQQDSSDLESVSKDLFAENMQCENALFVVQQHDIDKMADDINKDLEKKFGLPVNLLADIREKNVDSDFPDSNLINLSDNVIISNVDQKPIVFENLDTSDKKLETQSLILKSDRFATVQDITNIVQNDPHAYTSKSLEFQASILESKIDDSVASKADIMLMTKDNNEHVKCLNNRSDEISIDSVICNDINMEDKITCGEKLMQKTTFNDIYNVSTNIDLSGSGIEESDCVMILKVKKDDSTITSMCMRAEIIGYADKPGIDSKSCRTVEEIKSKKQTKKKHNKYYIVDIDDDTEVFDSLNDDIYKFEIKQCNSAICDNKNIDLSNETSDNNTIDQMANEKENILDSSKCELLETPNSVVEAINITSSEPMVNLDKYGIDPGIFNYFERDVIENTHKFKVCDDSVVCENPKSTCTNENIEFKENNLKKNNLGKKGESSSCAVKDNRKTEDEVIVEKGGDLKQGEIVKKYNPDVNVVNNNEKQQVADTSKKSKFILKLLFRKKHINKINNKKSPEIKVIEKSPEIKIIEESPEIKVIGKSSEIKVIGKSKSQDINFINVECNEFDDPMSKSRSMTLKRKKSKKFKKIDNEIDEPISTNCLNNLFSKKK